MGEWWHQLSDRERWMILGGGALVILLLIYFYIWSPLASSVTSLRQQIQKQQDLVIWMQHAEREIQQYRLRGIKVPEKTNIPILVVAEKTLSEQKLSRFLDQVQQPETNQLNLNFKTVPFDPLMNWLQMLWHTDSINVSAAKIIKTNTAGVVAAKISLVKAV